VPSTPHAPYSEADQKVDSPTDLDRRSWIYVARKTAREFSDDQCTDLAAALTYAVLALFPAAIALTSLLGLVGRGTEAVGQVSTCCAPSVPAVWPTASAQRCRT